MSYSDPFHRDAHAATHHQGGYGGQDAAYDPYGTPPQQHGYRDDTQRPPLDSNYPSAATAVGTTPGEKYPVSRGSLPPPKNTGDLRVWRSDEHANLWTKGGRGRCVGRFCCCSLMTIVFLILSIVFSIALFIRPPDISFNGIQGSPQVVTQAAGIQINLNLGISVKNPNFFGVAFPDITAVVKYPVGNADIGGGTVNNINFEPNSQTSFQFPFQINYNDQVDPNRAILLDLVQKCGLTGGAKQNINLSYTLTLGLRILFVTIHPSFGGSADFACPLSEADLKPFLGSVSIPGINA